MEAFEERLLQIELFQGIKLKDLAQIADLFERLDFSKDDYLTQQGEAGKHFYILESGQAAVWHTDAQGLRHLVQHLQPGDNFGITSLFLDDTRDASVRVNEGSSVLALDREKFTPYLDEHPAVRRALQIPEPIKKRLDLPHFKWMTPDEHTVYFATKTRWALAPALIIPLFITLLFLAPAAYLNIWLILGVGLIIAGPLTLLRWLDWRNDHYVVTNQRVVHHESRLLTLQVTVDQAPLHQIQNVTMLKLSPTARMFNYGTLIIETAGGRRQGSVTFRNLDNPGDCQAVIFDLLEKARSHTQASEQAAIRAAITQQIKPPDEEASEEVAAELEEEESHPTPELYESGQVVWNMGSAAPRPSADEKTEKPPSALAPILSRIASFLPHFREEKGETITWFKHPFILVKYIRMPAGVLLVSLIGGLAWAYFGGKFFGAALIALFIVWSLSLFWLLWQYEDWRNDIFQMTASHIIDTDRLPLGFRESKRQASLEQVQNINAEIPNFWARVFNYGNVIIETAGATGDLTFEWVMNPRAVQSEIFQRMEEVRARQREEETKQRSQEMARWFSVYNQMKEEHEI